MLHVNIDNDRLSVFARSAHPASQMVDTTVGPLEFATIGPKTGFPILLVSDAMGSLTSLHSVGERLAACFPGRRIIVWSRPGCGTSPALDLPAGEERLRFEATAVLPALLDALHAKRIDIVGNGCGAAISMIFAALCPERVGKVVAIAPMAHAGRQTGSSAPEPAWSALDAMAGMQAPLLLIQGMDDEFAGSAQIDSISEMVAGPISWVLLREHGRVPQNDNPDKIVSLIHSHFAAGLNRKGAA